MGNLYEDLHVFLDAKGKEFLHVEFPGHLGYHGYLVNPHMGDP
jgi:hypothetical protein